MQHSVDKNRDLGLKGVIYVVLVFIAIASVLFITIGIEKSSVDYALAQRVPRLIAIILTAGSIGFSTIIFQTAVDNRLLTPNVMGLDSLYVLMQTAIVFLFGSGSIFIVNKKINFIICVVLMVFVSSLLYKGLFTKGRGNIVFLLLIGMICGTLFSSLSSFMQMVIDPNEYLVLQNKLFASFNNINVDILILSLIMIIFITPFIYDDIKYLDVMSLGRDHAINLGVDYDRLVKKFLIVTSIFISISTALVGPITFLGLLVVNITRQVMKTYRHSYLIVGAILISIFILVFGQLLLERVLNMTTPVSVIINLIGGIYFMYLLLKENRL